MSKKTLREKIRLALRAARDDAAPLAEKALAARKLAEVMMEMCDELGPVKAGESLPRNLRRGGKAVSVELQRRLVLANFSDAQMRGIFVAIVAGRGFIRKRRTVLLKDLRVFGSKFIQEDHLWVLYDKRWARIEPFYQGQKVVLVGTAIEYVRKNNSRDYTLALEKVTKLWPART